MWETFAIMTDKELASCANSQFFSSTILSGQTPHSYCHFRYNMYYIISFGTGREKDCKGIIIIIIENLIYTAIAMKSRRMMHNPYR